MPSSFISILLFFIIITIIISRSQCFFENILNIVKEEEKTFGKILNIAEEEKLTFKSIVTQKGFRLKSYDITTNDDYYLVLHRIVPRHFTENYSEGSRKPVLLGHCLSGSSVDFFINSDVIKSAKSPYKCGNNLGFCLLSEGYDVWAINFRGNGFSQGSKKASNLNPFYWNFSLDEFAEKDLPAVIAFIQRKTGHQKMAYIGHGHGATAMFQLLSTGNASERLGPETISPFIALAPVVYIGQANSVLQFITKPLFVNALALIPHKFVLGELFSLAGYSGCQFKFFDSTCSYAYRQVFGDTDGVNESRASLYMTFFPSSTSAHAVAHFGQLFTSDQFHKFTPPPFINSGEPINLHKIHPDMDILIMNGQTDGFVVPADVNRLLADVGSVVRKLVHQQVAAEKFNFLDFLFSQSTDRLVNDPVLGYLQEIDAKAERKKMIELIDEYEINND